MVGSSRRVFIVAVVVCTTVVVASATIGATHARAAQPVKLATEARLDLFATPAVMELRDGRLVEGRGKVDRMNWRKADEQPRGYSVQTSVSHLAWREFELRFTPAASGDVTLTLMGPWQEATKGTLYQAEVYFDDLRADGATIANGGFESPTASGGRVDGWQSGGGRLQEASAEVKAAEGRRFARVWHNETLSTTLRVTGGQAVSLRFRSRAVVPADFVEMRRVTRHDTPAHLAAKKFARGVNLGNYLEAPPGQTWGASYSADDFVHIRREGFDHVRLPIAWHHYAGPGPEFKLKPEIFQRADFLVDQALRNGLNAIVNLHHFDDFTTDPAAQRPKLLAIWRQVAEHYASRPASVAFEVLNEPKDAATTAVISDVYAAVLPVIRRSNPDRCVLVGPGRWNQVSELPLLRLPDDDLNLLVTLHSYEPFYFTHQGATWAGNDVKPLKGIHFPGPPSTPLQFDSSVRLAPHVQDWVRRYNTEPAASNPCGSHVVHDTVREAKEWSDYYGRPIHFGEFGAIQFADPQSRANFAREFRQSCEHAGIGWALWDWKAGFRYWNEKSGAAEPGMHSALFGR